MFEWFLFLRLHLCGNKTNYSLEFVFKKNIIVLSNNKDYLLCYYLFNKVARRYLDRIVPMIQRFNSFLQSNSSFGESIQFNIVDQK